MVEMSAHPLPTPRPRVAFYTSGSKTFSASVLAAEHDALKKVANEKFSMHHAREFLQVKHVADHPVEAGATRAEHLVKDSKYAEAFSAVNCFQGISFRGICVLFWGALTH